MKESELPKEYIPPQIEAKWQKNWKENQTYSFRKDHRPNFVIDTPPPFTSGELHMGHVLNFVFIDVVARYKRMRGFNVYCPQGWDCHGLHTELRVEAAHNITKHDIPREQFKKYCIELTERFIEKMKAQMNAIGYSPDWNYEYRTMNPDYIKRVQLTFLYFYKRGLIYRAEHPVNWCPRCETAIANAEVEYETRATSLNYIKFLIEGKPVSIATTRPELLCACVAVAVHPSDDRYKDLIGKKAVVPIYNKSVPIIADPDVDPGFGTGIVMICTFGDKQDVEWKYRHNLPVIKAIDQKGIMTEAAGTYAGLSIEECKTRIVRDLERDWLLEKTEPLEQNVAVHERCGTPIEFLITLQWFAKAREFKDEVITAGKQMRWTPPHMVQYLIDWAQALDWDWVISRQRIFGTPIPIWYCDECQGIILAKPEDLPIDPIEDVPSTSICPRCGSNKIIGETDVLDCWMDSSITPLIITNWPNLDSDLFPTTLRPQGHEIIRTWAYYTTLRSLLITGKPPFKELLINGMVLAPDGRKMSKSFGNVIEPNEPLRKYGADAIRQWATMSGALGTDKPFLWKDIVFGYRFLLKTWNIARFIIFNLKDFDPLKVDEKKLTFHPVDRWILSAFYQLLDNVTKALDDYQFHIAILSIQKFTWNEFADYYLEIVKHRLYEQKTYGTESRKAAQFVLFTVLLNLAKILAPFTPHLSEEIYQHLIKSKKFESIHLTSWPSICEEFIDLKAEQLASIAKSVIGALRKYKSENGLALNAELPFVEIFAEEKLQYDSLNTLAQDLQGTMRIKKLSINLGRPKIKERIAEIIPIFKEIGPSFKSNASAVIQNLKKVSPSEIIKAFETSGKFLIRFNSTEAEILPKHVQIKKEIITEAGEAIKYIEPAEFSTIKICVHK